VKTQTFVSSAIWTWALSRS